jgi:hypothetical protein
MSGTRAKQSKRSLRRCLERNARNGEMLIKLGGPPRWYGYTGGPTEWRFRTMTPPSIRGTAPYS